MTRTSRLPGFYELSSAERIRTLADVVGLSEAEVAQLAAGLPLASADRMLGNVVGVFSLPLGVVTNLRVNGRDYLAPVAVEEPSIVAAASLGAKLARIGGGFKAESDEPIMIAQIQVLDVPDMALAVSRIRTARAELLQAANELHPGIVERGGGARDVETRVLSHPGVGTMLVVHVLVDVRDAMGANALNTVAEALAPMIAELSGGRVNLRILSNLAVNRLSRASCRVPCAALGGSEQRGKEIAQRIVEAQAMADVDPFRATTHNKGVLNGISALAVATGNDWRAIEAGIHAFAAQAGAYRPVTTWWMDEQGDLRGRIRVPLAFGIVGGTTRAHPTAQLAMKILGVDSARELGEVAASLGLAQNLAALRALVTDGIQAGHMQLHAQQVALAAGAEGLAADRLASRLIAEGNIRESRARELFADQHEPLVVG